MLFSPLNVRRAVRDSLSMVVASIDKEYDPSAVIARGRAPLHSSPCGVLGQEAGGSGLDRADDGFVVLDGR